VISQFPTYWLSADRAPDELEKIASGMAAAWAEASKSGARVLAIKPTPVFPTKPSDCVATSKDWRKECAMLRRRVSFDTPLERAAGLTKIPLIDMYDAFCLRGGCPPVVGGVLIYRDAHHITATYARSLARTMEQKLAALSVPLP
jgi:hypothetical protein